MKNSKNVLLTTVLTLLGLFSFAQDQETVTLISSKNLYGATQVFVDLYGNVQTESWDQDFIRIVLKVKTNGVTREVVKHLMTKKRFKITSFKKDLSCLQLSNPNLTLPVYINGKRLKEDVNYTIFAPRNIRVVINSDRDTLNMVAVSN